MKGAAMVAMVTGRSDAQKFVEQLVADPALNTLIGMFDDSPDGFPARRKHLEQVSSTLAPPDQEQVQRVLAGWKQSAPLRPPREDQGLHTRVGWLIDLALDRFDFRWGMERSFIPTSQELLDEDTAQAVYELADHWGLRQPNPADGDYDLVVVLGGLIRANVNRPALAGELLASSRVTTAHVTALAGDRSLGRAELDIARELGCPGDTEQDSLRWGMARCFGSSASIWRSVGAGLQVLTDTADLTVTCATAPRPGTGGRADTQTAFQWLLDTVPGITSESSRVLCVTSAIYWIDGHIRLLTQLPDGCELVTTGTAGANPDRLLSQTYLSQQYLQEIKSAINALPGLLAWAQA